MSNASGPGSALRIRPLSRGDLADLTRINAHHTGAPRSVYWKRVLEEFLGRRDGRKRVGLAAELDGRLAGYLLGEVRAFEFGSDPCGWVFAVGVEPASLRSGVASALLSEACGAFRAAGVSTVRAMVRRSDVPVLAFFRAAGFSGGSYVQLETDLGEQP